MNAEQLHAIARELQVIVKETQIVSLLAQFQKALQNLVSQPQHPQHQTQVQEFRQKIITNLNESSFNDWAVNRNQVAMEIGARDIFGHSLANRINHSFQENAATPEVIRLDIANIQTEVQTFTQALDGLTKSFDSFGIEFEELEAGEGEIGIVIPRIINGGLYDFSKDLRRIDFEIKTLSQLLTGSADNIKIRTISSSDFMVFLAGVPDLVNFFSTIVTSLRIGYEKLQELKKILSKLRELGNSSPETIENLEKDVENAMKKEVADVLAEIRPMYETAVENGLASGGFEVSMESTIKGISSRIDKGYSFSFRIGPPTVKNEDEPTEEETKQLQAAKNVADNNNRLQQMKVIKPGQQVLPLDWQTPDPANDRADETVA